MVIFQELTEMLLRSIKEILLRGFSLMVKLSAHNRLTRVRFPKVPPLRTAPQKTFIQKEEYEWEIYVRR